MDVIHGPRVANAPVYDAWLAALRSEDPRFGFPNPPFRNSLPITLAFAEFATYEMVPVRLQHHPLIATAALVWNGDLPRPLQQVLFDTAAGIAL